MRKWLGIITLLFAVVVYAQTTTEAINTQALQQTLGGIASTGLAVVSILYKTIPVIALLMILIVVLLKIDVRSLLHSTWFYLIVTAFAIWAILGITAQVSPAFQPIYQQITGNGCPFYWCP